MRSVKTAGRLLISTEIEQTTPENCIHYFSAAKFEIGEVWKKISKIFGVGGFQV